VVWDREKWLALVKTALNLQFPSNVGNILATVIFSRRALLYIVSCEQQILDALVDKAISHSCFECSSRIFLIYKNVCN
jgi:hypothetical protein